MNPKARILVLNGTCLDVAGRYRDWLSSLGADVVVDPSFRRLTADGVDAALAGAHAVILPAATPLLPRHMEACATLQALSLASSGYEYVDIEAATQLGIVVTHAPVCEGAEVVADLTWALILAVARQVPHHHGLVTRGRRDRGMGVSVWGKTLGVVGLGNIGRAVARRAQGFDMEVLATEIRPDVGFVEEYGIDIVPLDELLRRSDFVSLHLRITPETRHVIGARELGLMKSSAYLINAARQELVDEAALQDAILARRIAGAAMDDPPLDERSPLLNLPNVVYTPHIGNRAIEGVRAVFECAVSSAVSVLGGRRPEYVINPQVYDGPLRAPRPVD